MVGNIILVNTKCSRLTALLIKYLPNGRFPIIAVLVSSRSDSSSADIKVLNFSSSYSNLLEKRSCEIMFAVA